MFSVLPLLLTEPPPYPFPTPHFHPLVPPPFPTRRSSDLTYLPASRRKPTSTRPGSPASSPRSRPASSSTDRKSTTSELQSLRHLVCRLLPEKKKTCRSTDRRKSRWTGQRQAHQI